MKRKPVSELVYEQMFPKPKQTDPPNFQTLLQRSLILEVRQEVHAYYGHIDTLEAKYPGLDYCHPIHRIRLSRWQWHRRLFRAFDALRLTPAEIASLTKWEGTKWAKERYEREQGVVIPDTAADGMPHADDITVRAHRLLSPTPEEEPADVDDDMDVASEPEEEEEEEDIDNDDDGESDVAIESVGLVLNERLRDQIARREAGDPNAVLDEEWEQWLKNALEAGHLPDPPPLSPPPSIAVDIPNSSLLPADMLSAARAGQWDEIPEFLHSTIATILGRELADPPPPPQPQPPAETSGPLFDPLRTAAEDIRRPHSQYHYRRYSHLRLPGSSSSTTTTATATMRRAAPARERS